MEYGFTRVGKPTDLTASDCHLIVEQLSDRTLLYSAETGANSSSMYIFGRIACWAIKTNADWSQILQRIPDPATQESVDLRKKVFATKVSTMNFIQSEIEENGITESTFDTLAEVYVRLFPAYGNFDDRSCFLSDDFYGFEPHWDNKSFHSAPDFKTMLKEAFGYYRKDLARKVASLSGSSIALFSNFKDTLTAEQLIEVMGEELSNHCGGWAMIGVTIDKAFKDIETFKRLSPSMRLRLAKNFVSMLEAGDGFEATSMVEDCLTMMRSIPDEHMRRFRSDKTWVSAHNRAVNLASEEVVQNIDPIEFPPEILALNEAPISEDWQLKLLKTPWEYFIAGSKDGLDNCMGKSGYYTKAKNGDSYCLVAVDNEDKMSLKAAIEVSKNSNGWEILQFNGKSNESLDNREQLEDNLSMMLNKRAVERGSSIDLNLGAQADNNLNHENNRVDEDTLAAMMRAVERQLQEIDQDNDPEIIIDDPAFRVQQVFDPSPSDLGFTENEVEAVEPVDIPPLGVATEDELENKYAFSAVMLDGSVANGSPYPVPRTISVKNFHEAVSSAKIANNRFAFPASFEDLEQDIEIKLALEAQAQRVQTENAKS